MAGFENHAGFNITENKLQLVEVIFKNNEFILENVDEAYFNEAINFETDKETKIGALLQSAFNELLIKHHLKSSSVSFTLPTELFYIAQIPYDNSLLHSDLTNEFKWELSILYPYIQVKDLAVQFLEIDKNDYIPFNTALIIAIPRKYLNMIYSFTIKNNLKLKFIDHNHIASEKILELNQKIKDGEIILSLFIKDRFLSVIFSLNGKLIYLKSFPLNNASEISRVISGELSSNLIKINKSMINNAFIAGDELSHSIVASLNKSTDINFHYINPFEKIKPSAGLYNNICYIEKYNSFAAAAGIAYRLA